MENLNQFVQITKVATAVIKSEASWETKYHLIFSDEIFDKITETKIEVNWYDPVTSDEDDVMSYVTTLQEMSQEFQKVLKEVDKLNNNEQSDKG